MRIDTKKYILRQPNPFYAFMFALVILLWGLWIVLPFNNFALPITGSHYLWGAVAVVLGSGEMLVLKLKNCKTTLFITLQSAFWFFLTVAAISADVNSAGWIINLWLCTMCALGHINRKYWDI